MESNFCNKYSSKFDECFLNGKKAHLDYDYNFLPHLILCYYHKYFKNKIKINIQCFTMISFAFYKLKRLNELKWIVNKIENKYKSNEHYSNAKIYYRYSAILIENNMKKLGQYYMNKCAEELQKANEQKDIAKNKQLLNSLNKSLSSITEDKGGNPNDNYYFLKNTFYTYNLIQNQIKIKVLFLPLQHTKNDIDIYPKVIYLDNKLITPENIINIYNNNNYIPEIPNEYKCFLYENEQNSQKCIIFQTILHYLNNAGTLYFPPNTFREIKQNELINNEKPFVVITLKESHFISTYKTNKTAFSMGKYKLPERGGIAGFSNLGNTCYMNASLQCIVHCPLLVKHFLSDNKDQFTSSSSSNFVRAFYKFLQQVWNYNNKNIVSYEIRNEFVSRCNKFNNYQQHDSPEMIADFLNLLGNDLTNQSQKYAYLLNMKGYEIENMNYKNTDNSIIEQLFYGVLENQLSCDHCKKEERIYELFLLLDIPIPLRNRGADIHISKCFELLTQEKKKGEKSTVKCKICKSMVNYTTKIAFFPQYLLVYLKKFKIEGKYYRKYQTNVLYEEKLTISTNWTADGKKKYEYELMSVSIHHGNVEGGHYVAKVKVNNEWKLFNDDRVKSEYKPQDSDALVLFYSKISK